jgi:hypothetical protein
MTQLVQACDDLLKLQAVLSVHLHHFTPSCITAAMQQLHRLRQQDLHQLSSSSSSSADMAPIMQAVQLQLAGQLTQALLQQLPVVSGACLAAFLAAAASMRLVMPACVLEQMAGHLVNKALRSVSHTHAAATTQPGSSSSSGAMQHQVYQQMHGQDSAFPAHTASQLQQQQQAFEDNRPPHPTALAAWALAKLKLQQGALWGELTSIAGEQLANMSPNDCVVLAYACAKSGQHQPRMFNALQQQLRPHAGSLSPESISSLLWSYAAAGQYHHAWVSALAGAAADRMEAFRARALTTSLWACGRLRHADPRMLSAVRVQALACMSDMQPQSLSNLAWALATLGVADEALTAAVINRAGQLVEGFSFQGLANVGWAVVKLQQQLHKNSRSAPPSPHADSSTAYSSSFTAEHDGMSSLAVSQHSGRSRQQQLLQDARALLEALCGAAAGQVAAAKPQEVCNLLWACASLTVRHQPYLTAAAGRLAVVAEDAAPIDLSQALWALETLRVRRKPTQQALLRSGLNQLHTFGPQALSNLAWAVASSGMQYPLGLPAAVCQQLQALMPDMTPQGLATTLWALSKMEPVPQQVIHAASSHIQAHLPMYNAHDLCNVAMVAAKAGYKEPRLLQALAAAAAHAAAVTLEAAAAEADSMNSSGGTMSGGSLGMQHQGRARGVLGVSLYGRTARSMRHMHLTPQGVCNLVWAFAGMGWCDDLLMQQLQRVAVHHLHKLQPRNVAALCQGFALLAQSCDQLLAALPDALQQAAAPASHKHSASGKPQQQPLQYQQHRQHLDGLQRRLGAAGLHPQQSSLEAAARQYVTLLTGWPADSLALMLHAVAVTDAQDSQPALVLAVLRLLSRRDAAESLSSQRLCQLHMALTHLALQWGVASAGQLNSSAHSLVQQLTRDAFAGQVTPGACPAGDGGSMWQQQQQQSPTLGAAGASTGGSAAATAAPAAGQPGELAALCRPLLAGSLAALCLRAWQQHAATQQLSRAEQEVVSVLQGMGLQPLVQHWVQLTYKQADSQALRLPGSAGCAERLSRALAVAVGLQPHVLGPGRSLLALSVLSPVALSSSWPCSVLGQTHLQHKALASAGWQVVQLTTEEWDSLAGAAQQQQALLRRLCDL